MATSSRTMLNSRARWVSDSRTLGEELVGVELRDDGLEHLVADGWEDLLVVLEAEGVEDVREVFDVGS